MTFLADGHRRDLEVSGLSPETIARCQFSSAPEREVRAWLGFGAGGGMLIPYWRADGTRSDDFVRVKLDQLNAKGHREYRQPLDSANHLYLPPLRDWPRLFADPTIAMVVTEGEKKAAKACQEGLNCIGLGGVDSWQKGGRPIADLDWITWTGRMVLLVFDADLAIKPAVARAERTVRRGPRPARRAGLWRAAAARRALAQARRLPVPAHGRRLPVPAPGAARRADGRVGAADPPRGPPGPAVPRRCLAPVGGRDGRSARRHHPGRRRAARESHPRRPRGTSMKRAEVLAPNGHREPLNLYVVAVAPSGERKTGVLGTVMAPIRSVEDEEAARMQPVVQAAADEAEWLQTLIKQLRQRRAKAKPTAREAIRLELQEAEAHAPRPRSPRGPRADA